MKRNTEHDTRRNDRARMLVAGGLLASMMPLTTSAASPAAGAVAVAEYGGFTATSWSSPIRIEVFEPSLPIPVDAGKAQLEFFLGYSKVLADSSTSSGRSSLFWPGDPVGEGLKTFAEQLGLPSTPLTANGYPVQVNSQFPGDQTTQADNKIPGSIQQTTSGDNTAIAEVGFSPDGAVNGPDAGGEGGGASNPLSGLTDQLKNLLGGGLPGTTKAAAPANPLAMLVDVDGYVSVSRMTAVDGPVVTASRSTLGEVKILGGLITLGGIETVARASTDGAKGVGSGKATYGKMAIAGQQFSIGPDGIEAAGTTSPIPGLSDLPADALEQLGISIVVPEQVRTVDGDEARTFSAGLQVVINTKVLSPLLKALPTGVLAELIPAEAGPLKGVVAGLSTLAPKIVLTLGVASATVDTVPPIAAVAPAGAPTTEVAGPPQAGTVGVPPVATGGAAPVNAVPPAGTAPVADLVGAAPASAGLPDLFSIPGMLLIAAFVAAAVAGSWFRRLGVAALGIGAPCTHGLESGLPDLRKA
ncbi:choice-of-anchor P family protein [Nocardioides sp. WS12]|uniref:choice-of-anchor P family protein n=1 Tax=Nocardioides sp. WS12 TaxID=2486272 RepID=UPI0015FA9106|nr:choice-of-anchor P family protein [Nocardioides sp. WS12]